MSDAQKAIFRQIGDLLPFRQESDSDAYFASVEEAFPANDDDTSDEFQTEEGAGTVEKEQTAKGAVGKTPVATVPKK